MKIMKCFGISMETLINDGDIIIYDENEKKIKVGDIIVFTYNNQLFAHRVLIITKDHVLEFGENGKTPNWILRSNINGVAKYLIRGSDKYNLCHKNLKHYLFICLIAIIKIVFFKLLKGKYFTNSYFAGSIYQPHN